MAHKFTDLDLFIKVVVAVIAFSLCASSMYIVNDLMDLDVDRQHPTKRRRAFASGVLQIKTGAIIAPLLSIAAFLLAFIFLSPLFISTLALYLTVTTVYSFGLKGILLLDVFVLAGLYSLRILAGAVGVRCHYFTMVIGVFDVFFSESCFFEAIRGAAGRGQSREPKKPELARTRLWHSGHRFDKQLGMREWLYRGAGARSLHQ